VYSCKYHVILCPKYRKKTLVGKTVERIKEILFAKQEQYHYTIIEMEIMPDHVHLMSPQNKTLCK